MYSKQDLARRVGEQRRWIDEHGRTRAGYLARYGAADDPNRYGEGGAAIFAADQAELLRRERELSAKR